METIKKGKQGMMKEVIKEVERIEKKASNIETGKKEAKKRAGNLSYLLVVAKNQPPPPP